MEEFCLVDSLEDNIKKRKVTFQPVIQNKKRKLNINNEINILTYNLNRLKLKRKADNDDYENIKIKKIKISNENNINYNNLFTPIENNLKRKSNSVDDLDKLDGIKKNKLIEEKEQEINILNCNCIHICRCDYDYQYFKENNNRLPPDDLIYRYIN